MDGSAEQLPRLRALAASTATAVRLQQLATELLPHADAIADQVNRRAIAAEPALVDEHDPTAQDATAHSTRDNVGAILSMLAYGVPGSAIEPSLGALELFERLADRGDGLYVALRGYRLGISEFWQMWAQHLADRVDDADELHALLAASTSHMLTYVDRMSAQLAAAWEQTRRRRERGLDVAPEELVRHALFADDGGDEALARLEYDAGRVHLALALPAELTDARVAQLASRLRTTLRAQSVALRHDAAWIVWLAHERAPAPEDVAALAADVEVDPGAVLAIGEPAAGLAGFRTTYRQALDARRVGLLRGTPGVTCHRDVALLAVLCADSERARALARTELGPLAADDEATARLRDTVAAYLACGESHVGAAQRLFVHEKTVAYRVRQAEALLGRRVGDRRGELEAALLLHRAFDGRI